MPFSDFQLPHKLPMSGKEVGGIVAELDALLARYEKTQVFRWDAPDGERSDDDIVHEYLLEDDGA
jgi:hypothetical protein